MRRVLALLLLVPATALADVEIESESVYRSYDAPVLAEEDVVLQPFTQSFRLTAAGDRHRVAMSRDTRADRVRLLRAGRDIAGRNCRRRVTVIGPDAQRSSVGVAISA